jgi:hypothetical protein
MAITVSHRMAALPGDGVAPEARLTTWVSTSFLPMVCLADGLPVPGDEADLVGRHGQRR